MYSLAIRECSVTCQGFYVPPKTLVSLDLDALSQSLLREFASYSLTPVDLILNQGDGLFSYTLRMKLFSDLLSATISATKLECHFTRLLSRSDRDIAATCIQKILNACGQGLGPTCYIEVGLHAGFTSEPDRELFFTERKPDNHKWGGILAYKELQGAGQLLRIEIDQSWLFPSAAYIVWKTIGLKLDHLSSETSPWPTLFETLQPFGLALKDE